jgi:hypothetical protein
MKRWRSLCPVPKHSLLLSVACTLRRDERGNVARSRLYFVGYVTASFHLSTNGIPQHTSHVEVAVLSPIPTARHHSPAAADQDQPADEDGEDNNGDEDGRKGVERSGGRTRGPGTSEPTDEEYSTEQERLVHEASLRQHAVEGASTS